VRHPETTCRSGRTQRQTVPYDGDFGFDRRQPDPAPPLLSTQPVGIDLSFGFICRKTKNPVVKEGAGLSAASLVGGAPVRQIHPRTPVWRLRSSRGRPGSLKPARQHVACPR